MGSFLLMAGEPGERAALPNASLHLHQPLGGFQGQASDILIQAEEMLQTKRRIIRIPPAKAATRIYRYRASLQLFATVNAAGSSCPQIERPARRGAAVNARFRSSR